MDMQFMGVRINVKIKSMTKGYQLSALRANYNC
jgi:hypothetical protein